MLVFGVGLGLTGAMQVIRPIRPLTRTLNSGSLLIDRCLEDRHSCRLTIYELSVFSKLTIYNLSY